MIKSQLYNTESQLIDCFKGFKVKAYLEFVPALLLSLEYPKNGRRQIRETTSVVEMSIRTGSSIRVSDTRKRPPPMFVAKGRKEASGWVGVRPKKVMTHLRTDDPSKPRPPLFERGFNPTEEKNVEKLKWRRSWELGIFNEIGKKNKFTN